MNTSKKFFIGLIYLLLLLLICTIGYFVNKSDYVYIFHTYSHIQFDGIDYYIASNQNAAETDRLSKYTVPVYLVDNDGIVRDDHVYYANVFYDEEGCLYSNQEHTFLYFESALYTKDKNRSIEPSH